MHIPAAADLDIDIEKYLLPFIPRSCLHLLPRPLSHFLGYRDSPRKQLGSLVIAAWSFFGAFCGVAITEGVFMFPVIRAHGTPLIIGSFVGFPSYVVHTDRGICSLVAKRVQRPFWSTTPSSRLWPNRGTPSVGTSSRPSSGSRLLSFSS